MVTETFAATHGGHRVGVLHLTEPERAKTAVARAAARKRSLMGSYLGWVRPRPGHPEGLVGPAGEQAVHDSLRLSAAHGLALVQPDIGKVRSVLGSEIPGGPLDNAAWLTHLDPSGRPEPPILAPIEVKNIRHWLYPSSDEVFQLLFKAASLQHAHADLPLYPLLFCRERSFTASQMAHDLGFRIVNVRQQFLLRNATVEDNILASVRSTLGFSDLVLLNEADTSPLQEVAKLLPREASPNAQRWAAVGGRYLEHYRILRDNALPMETRAEIFNDLRREVRGVLGGEPLRW